MKYNIRKRFRKIWYEIVYQAECCAEWLPHKINKHRQNIDDKWHEDVW